MVFICLHSIVFVNICSAGCVCGKGARIAKSESSAIAFSQPSTQSPGKNHHTYCLLRICYVLGPMQNISYMLSDFTLTISLNRGHQIWSWTVLVEPLI